MEGIIFILNFGLALLVGLAGKNRNIGFRLAFISELFKSYNWNCYCTVIKDEERKEAPKLISRIFAASASPDDY